MANAQIFKAGTPVISYGQGEGHPTLYTPPYGVFPFDDSAPFNAHYNGAAGSEDFPAGACLRMGELKWQRDNLKYAGPGTGDVIFMVVVPTNYWISQVRFDVGAPDDSMAGAEVEMTAYRVRVDPTAPKTKYIEAEITDITDAAAAQGIGPIPLDVPSSTIIWLNKITGLTGTVTSGAIDAGASGYVAPLYVEPEFVADASGVLRRYETGALLLGIKIINEPNNGMKIWQARNDYYLTTRVTSFACPNFS